MVYVVWRRKEGKPLPCSNRTRSALLKLDSCVLLSPVLDKPEAVSIPTSQRIREIHRISRASIAQVDCAALEAAQAEYGRLVNKNKAKWVNKS